MKTALLVLSLLALPILAVAIALLAQTFATDTGHCTPTHCAAYEFLLEIPVLLLAIIIIIATDIVLLIRLALDKRWFLFVGTLLFLPLAVVATIGAADLAPSVCYSDNCQSVMVTVSGGAALALGPIFALIYRFAPMPAEPPKSALGRIGFVNGAMALILALTIVPSGVGLAAAVTASSGQTGEFVVTVSQSTITCEHGVYAQIELKNTYSHSIQWSANPKDIGKVLLNPIDGTVARNSSATVIVSGDFTPGVDGPDQIEVQFFANGTEQDVSFTCPSPTSPTTTPSP